MGQINNCCEFTRPYLKNSNSACSVDTFVYCPFGTSWNRKGGSTNAPYDGVCMTEAEKDRALMYTYLGIVGFVLLVLVIHCVQRRRGYSCQRRGNSWAYRKDSTQKERESLACTSVITERTGGTTDQGNNPLATSSSYDRA